MNRMTNYLDEPARILFFTLDEAVLFFLPFLVFMLVFGSPIQGGLLSLGALVGLKKLKKNQGQAFLWRLMYWYFPIPILCARFSTQTRLFLG